VSGGPDSLALLLLAHHSLLKDRVEAATVDHGLRPQSASEAEMVALLCEQRGIPHETLAVRVAQGNVQSEARLARYEALGQWAERRGLSAIATAHHADDQAETLVMRLNRASGLAGLAGIRPRGMVPRTRLPVVRPLLEWRRAELERIVADAGWQPVDDPSNANPSFDRVRIRQQLRKCDWLSVPDLARSAANLADADEALAWAASREWDEAVSIGEDRLIYAPRAPRAIRLRVMERILAHFSGSARGGDIARLADALKRGGSGTLGGVAARASKGEWTFRAEETRRRR
jgi:tRNA(Ile)-lysidine synthase